MAPADLGTLAAHARRVYERGRWRRAAGEALLIAPVAALSVLACGRVRLGVVCGVALLALASAFLWRGQAWAHGVWPGVFAGSVPVAAVLLVTFAMRHICALGGCWQLCVASCVASGLAAGILVGVQARRQGEGTPFLASAATVAILLGAPACAFAGLVGTAGMLAAFASGLVPLAWPAAARS